MSTSRQDRYEIYRECFNLLPLNQGELARLLTLGEPITQSTRNKVNDKLNAVACRGVPKSEAFSLQALKLLHLIFEKRGLDIKDLEFDTNGRITDRYISTVLQILFEEKNWGIETNQSIQN